MTKKTRPRTARRADERAARALVRDREKLAAMEPGGSPERPVEVPSSAVVELRARTTPCPQCQGELKVEDHRATVVDGVALREVPVICRRCHVRRTLWYRLAPPLPN